jgi:N6-L-threonylcarbamoyladenine synthase
LGYPAGAKVDHLAQRGNPQSIKFPRAFMKKGDLQFSFSGLKTAGHLKIKELNPKSEKEISDLCASYQEAIADVLVEKTLRALKVTGLKQAVITGGVSANSRVRNLAQERLSTQGYSVLIPPLKYCTDNAAMIGYVGIKKLNQGQNDTLSLKPESFMKIAEL